MAKFFGGEDPFDHQFFTQPFGGLFGGKSPFDDPFFTRPFDNRPGSRKQIAIEELNPDEEGGNNDWKNHMINKELSVNNGNEYQTGSGPTSYSYQRVTYGGPSGPYYTSSIGRRTGGDGVVLMEVKEEDKLGGESINTISKGIHDKGHSVTKKQCSDGQIGSLETLHNLNEDELASFDENWKINADKVLPGWNNGFDLLENSGSNESGWGDLANWTGFGGWPLPYLKHYKNGGESNGCPDLANWSGFGGWPSPYLENYGNGGAKSSGETHRKTSRKVIPIE